MPYKAIRNSCYTHTFATESLQGEGKVSPGLLSVHTQATTMLSSAPRLGITTWGFYWGHSSFGQVMIIEHWLTAKKTHSPKVIYYSVISINNQILTLVINIRLEIDIGRCMISHNNCCQHWKVFFPREMACQGVKALPKKLAAIQHSESRLENQKLFQPSHYRTH